VDDLAVGAVARGDVGRLDDVEDRLLAAGVVEGARLGELVDDRDRLDRLARVEQVLHCPEDQAVPLTVEVVGADDRERLGEVA
jgi:hypothetical protein